MNFNTTGLNVALLFINTRTGKHVALDETQIYAYADAQFVELDASFSEDRRAINKTSIKLRPCTSQDI